MTKGQLCVRVVFFFCFFFFVPLKSWFEYFESLSTIGWPGYALNDTLRVSLFSFDFQNSCEKIQYLLTSVCLLINRLVCYEQCFS